MTLLVAGVGGSAAVGPASGGKIYAFNNLTTTPQPVAPASPQRTTLSFYNPGPINLYVAPAFVQALNTAPDPNSNPAANVTLTPTIGALGGCFLVYAGGGSLTLTGECQGAWQALSASGVNNPLTVSDSNV